jgi:ribose transport system substrate-binding protein
MLYRITRRGLGQLAVAGAAVAVVRPAFADLPKLAPKDKYKVGFAQVESNNPWVVGQFEIS